MHPKYLFFLFLCCCNKKHPTVSHNLLMCFIATEVSTCTDQFSSLSGSRDETRLCGWTVEREQFWLGLGPPLQSRRKGIGCWGHVLTEQARRALHKQFHLFVQKTATFRCLGMAQKDKEPKALTWPSNFIGSNSIKHPENSKEPREIFPEQPQNIFAILHSDVNVKRKDAWKYHNTQPSFINNKEDALFFSCFLLEGCHGFSGVRLVATALSCICQAADESFSIVNE